MSVKVDITLLQHLTNGVNVATVNGSTVGQCLKHLIEQFPELKLFDEDGELLSYFNIYLNGESPYPEGLQMPVKDGDELWIVTVLTGG
ncbi:MoaD/ThiS family protein [Chloroflexota bacterium]